MRQKLGFAVVAVVVAVSLLSCVSTDRSHAVPDDVRSLAGVWTGWILGPSGTPEQAELTINPDGTYVSRMQGFSTTGVVRVTEQKMIAGSLTAAGGAAAVRRGARMTLGERAGTLVLSGYGGQSAGGPFWFEVTKQK
jgi:hypothetical protein